MELGESDRLSPSDELLITAACKQMARFATQAPSGSLSTVFQTQVCDIGLGGRRPGCELNKHQFAVVDSARTRLHARVLTSV